MHQPYNDKPESSGVRLNDPVQLKQMVTEADAAGLQVSLSVCLYPVQLKQMVTEADAAGLQVSLSVCCLSVCLYPVQLKQMVINADAAGLQASLSVCLPVCLSVCLSVFIELRKNGDQRGSDPPVVHAINYENSPSEK